MQFLSEKCSEFLTAPAIERETTARGSAPFSYMVVDNFLSLEFLLHLQRQFEGQQEGVVADEFGRMTAVLGDMHSLEFFLDPRLPRRLGELLQLPNGTYEASRLPLFLENSRCLDGLQPHTDFEAGKSEFSMLVYLQAEPTENGDGNLLFWKKSESGSLSIAKTIRPIVNRMVAFEVSRNSWHSVTPVRSQRLALSSLFQGDSKDES